MNARSRLIIVAIVCLLSAHAIPSAAAVDLQPLAAQAVRVADALDKLGAPLAPEARKALDSAAKESAPAKGVAAVEQVLDPHCLLLVQINPESRVKVGRGPAEPELVEGGWQTFLVKVTNEAGVTAKLNVTSPNAGKLAGSDQKDVANRWLDILQHTEQPLQPRLSGLGVEYRVVSLYSRDAGQREAKLSFDVGQGTQDLGFRAEQDVLFTARPAVAVALSLLDEEGKPTTAALVIRDRARRGYPAQ